MLVDMVTTSLEDDLITRPEIGTYEPILKYCCDQEYDRRMEWFATANLENNKSGSKINSLLEDDAPDPPSRHSESRPEALTTKRQHGPRSRAIVAAT